MEVRTLEPVVVHRMWIDREIPAYLRIDTPLGPNWLVTYANNDSKTGGAALITDPKKTQALEEAFQKEMVK